MPDVPVSPLPVLFPSDITGKAITAAQDGATPAAVAETEFVLVGRLLAQTDGALWIGDAYATVQVSGTLRSAAGSLVRLQVQRQAAGHLALARLIESTAPLGETAAEHTRLIERRVGQNLRSRAQAMQAVRAFFSARDFVEVDTPLLVPSPGLDLHLDAVSTPSGYLITSPEYQMKRLLVGGMPRIFQVSHVFRAGELGALHNPEFSMLEWYRAFAEVEAVMRDTEELVRSMADTLLRSAELVVRGTRIDLAAPFLRLSVSDAFGRFAGLNEHDTLALAEQSPDAFFRLLVELVEPGLARLEQPVFLTDYPISQASLARPKPSDPRLCERFELYVGGVELCNGFGELTSPGEQRRRLLHDQGERARLGKTVYPIDERFLAALAEGMPPSAGNALGLDRLIALCLGEATIAATMAFPAPIV